MDIFKGIGDFFGGLFGQKKKREDEQQQPQQQQSAVSFNSTPKLGDNFANNSSNPTQPQQPKEFAKSSVDLNPVKPVQPVQPQPQVNRDQERQQLANQYRQEETDRYNQGSDHVANFLNDVFSGGKTAQMRENTINQNIQNRVNAEMLRKYGPDDQQVKQNIAQTSQDINNNATSVNDFTKNYNNTVQQTVASPVSAVKGAANSVVETMPKVSGAVTELGANTIKLFDEDNQFANNLIDRVRADREKNVVRKTLNSATGLTDQDNKMAYGLGSSGTRMAIDAAMTPVTGGVAPALVHGVEAHSDMMDSLDNIEARKKAEAAAKGETYTPSSFGSRYLAATANAGAQAAIEKLGIDNVTGKIGGKFAKNMVGRAVTGALGEAGEEAAQQYAENFTKKLFDNKQNIHEGVAESALMGGIMGGAGKMAFGGMDSVKNPYKSNDMADGEVSISKLHPDTALGNTNRNAYYNPKSLYEAERNATIPTREKITLAEAERQNRGGDLQYTPKRATNIGRLDGDQLGFTKDELVGKFTGDTRKRMSERSFNMLQDLRANNPYVTGDGQEIHLSGRGNKKFVNTQAGTDAEFIAKMRSTPRINELIQNSEYSHTSPDTKNHGIAPDGFDYRDVNFKYGGKDFNTTFNVARNNTINRNTLYGATTKENISTPGLRDNPSTKSYADVYTDSIAQNPQNVNDSVKYRLPNDNSNLPEVNYTETEGTPIYRGQAQAGRGIIKNQTNFADSGNYENGAFFTDNLDTAHKYGDNILETRRNDKNTVSVQESDNLQAMANKRMDEIMRNPKLYDEMDEDEYDLLEQMALGRPEAFAQYTKKPFVETGDKFGESGEVVYFKGVDDDAGIIRFKQKAEAENLARVAKENLQARHQELTGDQSIAFNEWANELERRAQGFFDEKTGKITINDGDLNTLNHELGHKLLTRTDNRAELLADIRNTVGDEALNAKYGENYAQQVANMNPEERANLFAEEYLADGFSDYYNGILAGEDSQRLGAKLGIPPRVLATYDRIVEAIKGILGLQQDTLKQFYAQAETGKFAQNHIADVSKMVGSETTPAYKITQDSKGDLVEIDQNIFEGVPRNERAKTLRKYLQQNLQGNEYGLNYDRDGNVRITKDSTHKIANPRQNAFTLGKKGEMISELPDILTISQKTGWAPDGKDHSFARDGFEYRQSRVKLGDEVYTVNLNVGLSQNGKVLYEINGIKKEPPITGANSSFESSDSFNTNSIAQNGNNVNAFNRQYEPEIQDLQNVYQKYGDDFEFNLTPEQQVVYEHLLHESPRDSEGRYIDPATGETTIDQTAQNIEGDLPETNQKTRKFAETVLDTDTPPKDFVKLMHAGDESLKYTPKKNSEMWNRATKSVQESPERVFNELENTRVANDETMAKGIALAKHYQAMGDDLKASELYVELAKKATEAGRTVQALNLMRRTTPEGVLMSTMREVESYNDKMKNKPNKQINITPEQRAEFLGRLREAYAMPEGN